MGQRDFKPCQIVTTCLATCGDKASYNSAYIATDGHELLLKIFVQILRVPHDMSTIYSAKK